MQKIGSVHPNDFCQLTQGFPTIIVFWDALYLMISLHPDSSGCKKFAFRRIMLKTCSKLELTYLWVNAVNLTRVTSDYSMFQSIFVFHVLLLFDIYIIHSTSTRKAKRSNWKPIPLTSDSKLSREISAYQTEETEVN